LVVDLFFLVFSLDYFRKDEHKLCIFYFLVI